MCARAGAGCIRGTVDGIGHEGTLTIELEDAATRRGWVSTLALGWWTTTGPLGYGRCAGFLPQLFLGLFLAFFQGCSHTPGL